VFAHPHTGHPYDASKMRQRFKAALVRAKVREVRFHDLRHTYGTAMAAAGAPLRALQEWMGHKDYATTAIYADFAPDPTQGARLAEVAFGGTNWGTNLRPIQTKRTPAERRYPIGPIRQRRLITRRSQVRIPPPLLRKPPLARGLSCFLAGRRST